MTRIVLAYPLWLGGPEPFDDDGIAWLGEQHAAEVVTLMLDVGQGRALEALRDRALTAGAVRAHVLDVADEFAGRFVLPTLKAGALHLDGRSSTLGLARMITAQKLVEVAAIEQTMTVAHGYADHDRRIATAVRTLDHRLAVIALPQAIAASTPAPTDPPASEAAGSSEAAFVELTFARGQPTAINGVAMPLTDLIGSIDMLVRKSPATIVLHGAHRGLQESVIADPSELQSIARQYSELIDTGAWFSPARQELDAVVDEVEQRVSGTVRLQLSSDACRIVEIKPLEEIERKVEVRT